MEYPECPICLDIYGINQEHIRAPKIIDCGHSLCKECLEGIIKKSESKFECPECKTQINNKDIKNFITNMELIRIINSCFNIPEKKENNENEAKSLKIISLGPAGVGKTSIFKRLIKDNYSDNYKMTMGLELSNNI